MVCVALLIQTSGKQPEVRTALVRPGCLAKLQRKQEDSQEFGFKLWNKEKFIHTKLHGYNPTDLETPSAKMVQSFWLKWGVSLRWIYVLLSGWLDIRVLCTSDRKQVIIHTACTHATQRFYIKNWTGITKNVFSLQIGSCPCSQHNCYAGFVTCVYCSSVSGLTDSRSSVHAWPQSGLQAQLHWHWHCNAGLLC